jgi:ABC-type branched-subunit amino acid transport system ATPase component
VQAAKLYAFGLAASIAALGGILLAFRDATINYAVFAPFGSISVVVYAVIGGVGFAIGPLFAAPFAVGGIGGRIVQALGLSANALNLVSGALLLLVVLANPNGLAYENVRVARLVRDRVRRGRRPRPVEVERGPALAARAGGTLEVEHLSVRFGGVTALQDVSLVVRPGEVVGLIGPNGAGKTTFIDAVTGFVKASPGATIRLDGASVETWSPVRRARAGLGRSFQSVELFDDLTVLENLLAACDDQLWWRYGTDLVRPGRTTVPEDVWETARDFGLDQHFNVRPEELPFGERRLVAVARTLAGRPSVVLLDEPAAGLSDVESQHLGGLIVALAHQRGLAVLMIEHDVALVSAVCDRVVVLDFGKKLAEGTPQEVTSDELVIAAYLGEPTAALESIAETVGADDRAPA